MGDRLQVRRALDGPLTRTAPVSNRFIVVSGFRVVVSDEFWMIFSGFRKVPVEPFGNPCVIFEPRTLQQGLVGGIDRLLRPKRRRRRDTIILFVVSLPPPS